ncbi:MAG: nucleotide sugar dehydrogenase [Myxococcota bacterium]
MKVAVIGVGRVGLPLALAFLERGAEVVGVDINERLRESVAVDKRMPFKEPGFEALLEDPGLPMREDVRQVEAADFFIVTVGTPLLQHLETDLTAVTRAVRRLCEVLRPGNTVIMRSTTAPKTTRYVKHLIERESGLEVGKDVYLACCPERILEGQAREELFRLPQIVGTEDEGSKAAADALFARLGVERLHCDFITAELVKLFNNTSRYAYFAVANALAMIAMEYDAEPHEIMRLTNHDYPRPINAKPGLTAGTCLRKDFGMISEAYWSADMLIQSWRINESLPKYLVDYVERKAGSLRGRAVAILGYTFKRDADDTRDSLAAKLIRYVLRSSPQRVTVHDPFIEAKMVAERDEVTFTTDLEAAVRGADVVFVATNHTAYDEAQELVADALAEGGMVVDIWNALRTGRVLASKGTLRA